MRFIFIGLIFCSLGILFSGCAVITGGTSYYANIEVPGSQDAEIQYLGRVVGKGRAIVEVERKNADKFFFTVKEADCPQVDFQFHSHSLRGWAMVGSYFSFGIVGLLVDGISGAFWKPDSEDPLIHKLNCRNFLYQVRLPECEASEKSGLGKGAMIDSEKKEYNIHLFNGKTLKGKLLEKVEGKYLRIQVQDNIVQTISWDDIIDLSLAD